jgi:large subunit ribosomal protein L9
MRVIFLRHIGKHKLGDVADVAGGYARYLLAQNFVMFANEDNLKKFDSERSHYEAKQSLLVAESESVRELINGKNFVFEENVKEDQFSLFGSVNKEQIVTELRKSGVNVTHNEVILNSPLKTLGEHHVVINLLHGVTAEINVIIEPKRKSG